MATKIGDAFIALRIDRAAAEADARSAGQSIGSIFQNVFSTTKVIDVFKNSIQSASDLNTTLAKTKTVFGDATDQVVAFGKSAATNFGLSEQDALRVASSIGNLATNLGFTSDEALKMSEQITQVGADLGAAFNQDTATVVDTLTKGLAGQTRGLKAYGIVLNDVNLKAEAEKLGLYDGTGALDAHSKAAASLQLILQQTTKFQGDFAASSDTVATSQRVAKAEQENASASLGQNFLPIYQKIVVVVGEAAKAFGALPGPIQVGVLALAALVALSGPIGTVVAVVEDLAVAIAGLELSGGEILALVGAIAFAAVGIGLLASSHDDATPKAERFTSALQDSSKALLTQATSAGIAKGAINDLTPAFDSLSDAILKALPSVDGTKLSDALIKDFGNVGLTAKDTAKELGLLQQVLQDKTITSARAVTDTFTNLNASQKEFLAQLLITSPSIADFQTKLQDATGPGKLFNDTTTKAGTALLSMYEIAQKTGTLGDIANTFTDAARGANDFTAGLVSQAEADLKAQGIAATGVPLYNEYLRIAAALPPAQQAQALALSTTGGAATDAAGAIGDMSDATDGSTSAADDNALAVTAQKQAVQDNTDATKRLSDAVDAITNKFDLAKAAADDFSKAIDSVFNPTLDLEKANEALNTGLQGIITNVKEAKKGHDKLATSLDISTASGDKNRASIAGQVEGILAQAKANVANGTSVDDATAATGLYRQQLEDTLTQLGFNKDQVHAYIDQLGLTPENVQTAVQLTHDEETKASLEALLKQLGTIDAGASAKIEAEIDQGAYDEAANDLRLLAQSRTVRFIPTTGRALTDDGQFASAAGNYFPAGTNATTSIAEPGAGDEVVLPLDNPAAMAGLLAKNNVGSRIMAAMGGSGGGSMIGVNIQNAHFTNGTDAEAVAQLVLLKLTGSG